MVALITFLIIIIKNNETGDETWSMAINSGIDSAMHDSYIITDRTIYRLFGDDKNKSFVVYDILSVKSYDYSVSITQSSVSDTHKDIIPDNGMGTLTMKRIDDNTLFISHKVNNKSITPYYAGFYVK